MRYFFRQTFSKIVNYGKIKNTGFQVDENTFFRIDRLGN
jgi:hypothetical protein